MKSLIFYMSIVIGISTLLFLTSCRDRKNTKLSKDGFIIKFGTYAMEDGNYVVDVSESPKGILRYVVKTIDGTLIIQSEASDIRVSIYHKWRLYWDTQSHSLWAISSDRGDYVWLRQEDGLYKDESLYDLVKNNVSFKTTIPQPVLSYFSNKSYYDWIQDDK